MKPKYLFILLLMVLTISLVYVHKSINEKTLGYNYYESNYRFELPDPIFKPIGKAYLLKQFKFSPKDTSKLKLITEIPKKLDNKTIKDVKMWLLVGHNKIKVHVYKFDSDVLIGKFKNGHLLRWGSFRGRILNNTIGNSYVSVTYYEIPEERKTHFYFDVTDNSKHAPFNLAFGNIDNDLEILEIVDPEIAKEIKRRKG